MPSSFIRQRLKRLSLLLLTLLLVTTARAAWCPSDSVCCKPDTLQALSSTDEEKPVATEGKHLKRKQRKTLRQLVGTADSLRLRLRYAADHGYMLQWVDTLVRQRLRNGEMDSLKYAKLVRRLSRIDRRLFQGDSLLAKNYRKKNIDTAYITRPDARWTIKLRTNISGAMLKTIAENGTERRETEVRSEYRGTVSVAVAYRGMGLGLALNPAKLAGKNKDYEFNLNSYGNKFGFDIVYLESNTYHGTQTIGAAEYDVAKGTVSQKALNLNAYYAFNGRRFSFPAAFSQSYIQRRSAGSWMIGASFDGSRTTIDGDESVGRKPMKIKLNELAIGAGYAYNLVAGRRWLFHLSALPTYTVYSHDNMTVDGERSDMKHVFMSSIITGRGAALYSWRNKFAGATMVYNFSFAGKKDPLEVLRDKWRLRLFFGFRF